jgi:AcrR family transcriptional regulator
VAGSTRAIRKAELLDVSTKLFAVRGFHGTRMDDVADAAGLNKATVYHYYSSKALILYDIYMRATEETLRVFDEIDEDISASDALRQYTTAILHLIARNVDQSAVYFHESPYLSEWLTGEQVKEIRSREHLYEDRVQEIIDRGIRTGDFVECDSKIIALGYIGLTAGAHRWLRPRGRLSAEDIAAEFAEVFLRGLRNDSSSDDAPKARSKPAKNGGRKASAVRSAGAKV